MTTTAGADGASAQGSDTPGAPNVSDGTPAVGTPATTSSGNDNSASTPAATRSDDTRGAGYDLTKLLDRLDALPESIANAVKEATPVTTSVAPTSDNSTQTAETGSTATDAKGGSAETSAETRTRSQKFAGWWFGQ